MFLRRILQRPHHILYRVRTQSPCPNPNTEHKSTQSKPIPTQLSPNKSRRFRVTAEVLVSKIFPAGFCWQGASVLAEKLQYADDSVAFALTTGIGDGLGVMVGHMLFYTLAKSTYLSELNLQNVRQMGVLLGTAAFCSGTLWQPTVNLCHSMDVSFLSSMGITSVVCGTAFYSGLRLGRHMYKQVLSHVEAPNRENRMADVQLSASIGGATGTFVGTDIGFSDNCLKSLFGIFDYNSVLQRMSIAGLSTMFGFGTVQTIQNIGTKNNWTDIKLKSS